MRWVIAGFATAALLALSVSIHLSTLELNFGTLIFGSPVLRSGGQAAFRVHALEPISWRPVPLREVAVRDENEHSIQAKAFDGTVLVTLAESTRKSVTLHFRITTDSGVDQASVQLPVSEQARTALRIVSHRAALIQDRSVGSSKNPPVALYPEWGHAVLGLPSRVYGRWLGPTQPSIEVEAMDIKTTVGDTGVFVLDLPARHRRDPLELKVKEGDRTHDFKIPLDFRPSQLRLLLDAPDIIAPETTLKVSVKCLPFRDPVLLDVWIGDVLVATHEASATEGHAAFSVLIPSDAHGWLRLEAYRNLFAPEGAISVGVRWIGDAPHEQELEKIARLISTSADADDVALEFVQHPDRRKNLLPLVLSRLHAPGLGMPKLHSTVEDRQAQVRAYRDRLRGRVNALFVLLILAGLTVVTTMALRGRLQSERDLDAVLAETGDLPRSKADETPWLAQWALRLQMTAVLCAVLLAVYSIWLLMTYIQWSF